MAIYMMRDGEQTINIDWTSLSAMPADYVSRGSFTFSGGLTVSGTATYNVGIPLDMSNLKKVTIESSGNRVTISQPGWDYIGITDWTSWTSDGNRYKSIYGQRGYGVYGPMSSYNGIGHAETSSTSTQLSSFTTGNNQGDWNLKIEIDLTDGSVVYSSTAPYTFSSTADASSYLTEMKTYGYVYMSGYVNGTTWTAYSTTITYQ